MTGDAHHTPEDQRPQRDLQNLCDRLDEVFEMDDTPDALCQEAKEAIEELWEQRDRRARGLSMIKTLNPHRDELCKFVDSILADKTP